MEIEVRQIQMRNEGAIFLTVGAINYRGILPRAVLDASITGSVLIKIECLSKRYTVVQTRITSGTSYSLCITGGQTT